MLVLDSLLQLLVGFLIFILPYPIFIIGFFVYFFNPTNRSKMGIMLIASGAIAVCFWFTLLEVYASTFGTYSAIILNDINSTKLPLLIGALSIVLGVLSIIGRKRLKPTDSDLRAD
jgi:hypothetical protein